MTIAIWFAWFLEKYENVNDYKAFYEKLKEKEEKEKGPEKIFKEITVKNFSNMGKEIVKQMSRQ